METNSTKEKGNRINPAQNNRTFFTTRTIYSYPEICDPLSVGGDYTLWNWQYSPASWYQRLIGFLIDYIFCFTIAIICGEQSSSLRDEYEDFVVVHGWLAIIFIIYYLTFEYAFGRTLGKMLTRTFVTDLQDQKPSFGKIVGRTLCRLIPLDGLSYLWNYGKLGSKGCWHDSFSETVVTNCNWNTKWNYFLLFDRFKSVNKGYMRLNWVISILLGILSFGAGFILYWAIARIYLWIMDGFKEEMQSKKTV